MSTADQERLDSNIYAALCLVRDLRANAIRMNIHPAAIRTAIKYALLVDTHETFKNVPTRAIEGMNEFTDRMADKVFREAEGLPPTEEAVEEEPVPEPAPDIDLAADEVTIDPPVEEKPVKKTRRRKKTK